MKDIQELLDKLTIQTTVLLKDDQVLTAASLAQTVKLLEEYRSVGLKMIRDGRDVQGTNLIINFLKESFQNFMDAEFSYLDHMQRFLTPITDEIIDRLADKGVSFLHANCAMDYQYCIFTPCSERVRFGDGYISVNALRKYMKDGSCGWIDTRLIDTIKPNLPKA